jgi:hypothetical protein
VRWGGNSAKDLQGAGGEGGGSGEPSTAAARAACPTAGGGRGDGGARSGEAGGRRGAGDKEKGGHVPIWERSTPSAPARERPVVAVTAPRAAVTMKAFAGGLTSPRALGGQG